jgi:transposase
MDRLQELVRLHRMGNKGRTVARLLRMSPNTEQRYRQALLRAGLLLGEVQDLPELATLKAAVAEQIVFRPVRQEVSSIAAWRDRVVALLEKGAGPQAIFDCLKLEDEQFQGSLSAVKRLCRRLGGLRPVREEEVVIPVQTAPGEVAQVDFGYVGKFFDPASGQWRKTWVFALVLGYSRQLVARLVFDQRIETWLQLHVEAFAELGGVVRTVVPDNLKAAVVRAAFAVDEPTGLQRSYREWARHYGCQIDPTPVRDPAKKGKVESAIKYLQGNFFKPRTFADIEEARRQLARWVQEIANRRAHGTTRRRPAEVFAAEEAPQLQALPAGPFELVSWHQATVQRDSHVCFDRRLYSVPWTLLGQTVWVRATAATVTVHHQDERVATHARRGHGPFSTQDQHLPPFRRDYRHREPAYWQERAAQLGEVVDRYIREVWGTDRTLSRLRLVQGMVLQLEQVAPSRAQAACARASYYGNYTLRGLKDILRLGLDQLALPEQENVPVTTYRFARPPSDFLVTVEGGTP